jgi:hypothetical protein
MAKKKIVNNPYKVNQYTDPDPRQAVFLKNYLNPKSKTFGIALQSALAANYSKDYAEKITVVMPVWLADNVRKFKQKGMVEKAERNLEQFLDMKTKVPAIGPCGPIIDKDTKKPVKKINTELIKAKIDVSKFVAERLGKKDYAQRSELTGEEGKPIPILGALVVKNADAKRDL